MILVDSNIPMYAAGAEHPNKAPSIRLLEAAAEGELEAAVDAEALQEILHRYRAIGRWEEGRRVYDLVRRIFPLVIPITSEVLDRARALLDDHSGLMARDALHAGVVEIHALDSLCSYDRDFDAVATIHRTEPQDWIG